MSKDIAASIGGLAFRIVPLKTDWSPLTVQWDAENKSMLIRVNSFVGKTFAH
jgi:hypothetical protein